MYTDKMSETEPVSTRITKELNERVLERIEKYRLYNNRSDFVRQAIREKLERNNKERGEQRG